MKANVPILMTVLVLAHFAFLSEAAEPSPIRLPMLPPAQESALRSDRSDHPTVIQFVNRTGADLQLIWLDFEGQRRPYGTISAAEPLRRTTYATHAWVVADSTGKARGLFVADEKEAIAEIGGSTNAAPSVPPGTRPAPPVRRERDVTFIVTSDVHYDAFENEDRNDRVRETLRAINAVTNLTWPDELGGGRIAKPRGVLVLGDVIDDGDRIFLGKHQTPRQFFQFAADFGLDGTDGLLNFPVFETWGNHDGPPVGAERFGFSFQARLKERNLRRQQKGVLTNLSTNGLHYSWDWDGVHFVMLGLYPADVQNPLLKRYSPVWHDPQRALAFLSDDLARHVGASGRPVVLLSHCGFDTDWWHTNDWRAAYEAAKPYRVALYMYGHTGTGLRKWTPDATSPALDCVNTGQTEKGFFVVQFSGDRLRLAYRIKRGRDETLPDGKRRWVWDGAWEWRYTLEKKLAKTVAIVDPPEKGFYAKRFDYEGIVIKASTNVVDEAFFAARDRLSMMLSNLPSVRVELARAGAELHIIGRDEVTTDLPEWRHDKGKPLKEYNGLTRDQRTRGMGGLHTSCGEENLLKLEKDRYRGRDICVHEFAHNIYQHGMAKAVREKFREQHRRSLERGLWTGSYAGSNHHEFFAELSMWYFGTRGDLNMKGPKPANGREGLKAYDPEAFALMDEFYGGRMESEAAGHNLAPGMEVRSEGERN